MDEYSKEMIKRYLVKRKQILVIAVAVMIITSVPYLIGFASEGVNWRFTGFIIGVEDGNSYIAKMLSGSYGAWLFKTPYSTMEQQGVLAFLPYILLGKAAAGTAIHYQLVVLYHCFRLFSGILAILAAYDLISIYIKKRIWKIWALSIYVLGGGGGWILVLLEKKGLLGSLPLDFISPESFGFLGLFGFPHLAFARAMLLWGLVLYLERRSGYLTGLLWMILGLMQPLYVPVAWCVLGTHNLLQLINALIKKDNNKVKIKQIKDDISNTIKAIIISSPLIIYTGYAFVSDPFLITWATQNLLPSPHIVHYIIAYGLYLPIAALGIRFIVVDDTRSGLLLMGWLVILPLLVYAPVATQRRLAEGIWVVITIGLINFFENRPNLYKAKIIILYLAFPSTIIIYFGAIICAITLSTPIFRPIEEVDMYLDIARTAETNSVFLSSYDTGNNLPAWAPVSVVFGHGPETTDHNMVKDDVVRLYSSETSEQVRKKLLKKYHVDYIIVGPKEQEIGSWSAAKSDQLLNIYEKGDYAVYKTLANHGK